MRYTILALIAWSLWHLPTFAQTRHEKPSVLYSSHANLTVKNINLSSHSTELTLHYDGQPYGAISMTSATHLVDEQGQAWPIKGVREFSLDSLVILPESGQMDFTLLFEPLPEGTRIFDLIEGQQSSAFRIYGITNAAQQVEIPRRTEGIDPSETTEAMLRPDSVCIQGHITNYSRRNMPRLIRSSYHSEQLDFTDGSVYPICCRIDSSGHFSLSFLTDHTIWNFLELVEANRILPFFVHPGDTLQIDIDNYGQWNEHVRYTSLHGYNTCSGLMHLGRDLIEQYLPGTTSRRNYDTYLTETEVFYRGKSRFFDYIAWKYKFTPWEAQLLGDCLKMNKAINRLDFLNEQYGKLFTAWYKLPEDHRPDYAIVQFYKPEELEFLKEVNWSNPELLFVFNWLAMKELYYQHSPLCRFVYEAEKDPSGTKNLWDSSWQEQFKQRLLEDLPGMAPNLVEDFILSKAPWAEDVISTTTEMTYISNAPTTRQFINTLLPECNSEFIQLLFIDKQKGLEQDSWYSKYHNFIEDFSDNEQICFVLVVESDDETAKMEQRLRRNFPHTPVRFVNTEMFLKLCEDLRISTFLEDRTIDSSGKILRKHLHSYDERIFRDGLKRLQKLKLQKE